MGELNARHPRLVTADDSLAWIRSDQIYRWKNWRYEIKVEYVFQVAILYACIQNEVFWMNYFMISSLIINNGR